MCGKPSERRPSKKGDSTPQHQPHVVNFLDCVRSRKKPNSDIETTHRTTSACLIANVSLRVGRKLRWDRKEGTVHR